jgi:hypothetical protein
MIKFERLKSHKGVKLKNICNFIDNSKIKKILIKWTWTKCEGKINFNFRGWSEFLKELM